VVARDGVEALDFLLGQSPDNSPSDLPAFVLLDLKLPKMDGFDVLRRLRQTERTKLLPVVVMTSSREERDRGESYRLGANSYIRKPVDFDKFQRVVGKLGKYWLDLNEAPPVVKGKA
jgi:two-component system response regulator